MKIYRHATYTYLSLITVLPLLFLCLIYIYDPLQIYHKSFFSDSLKLHESMRTQAAGIINNFEFNSIILGTSMLENTSSKEAEEKLGGQFVNLSVSGSDFFEREPILSYALKKKNLNHVIYSLDSSYLHVHNIDEKFVDELKNKRKTFEFLYDNNPFNNIKAYWNNKFLTCTLVFSMSSECTGVNNNLDHPNSWYADPNHYSRFGGIDNWFSSKNSSQIKKTLASIVESAENPTKKIKINIEENVESATKYIDKYLLKYVKQYPDTNFHIVFPPYSRMNYAIWKNTNVSDYEIHKEVIRFMALQSRHLNNLYIYGWENYSFLDDISNYKDLGHYHPSINSLMLSSIIEKDALITHDNVTSYLAQADKKATDYDIVIIANKIKEYLLKEI